MLAWATASALAVAAAPARAQSAPELVRVELAQPGTMLESSLASMTTVHFE